MKWILRVVLFFVLFSWCYGGYLSVLEDESADRWIGFGILAFAMVLLPLFLWYRYKNKKLEDYTFKIDNKNTKKSENQ
jgi:hypothetical protein